MSETIVGVDRALEILLLMYHRGEELGVSQISRELGLGKSTVHRTLATLLERGFIYSNTENEKYWLGRKIYLMGLAAGDSMNATSIIKPFISKLFDEYNEVINVSVLDTDMKNQYISTVVMKESKEKKVLNVDQRVGSTTPAHASSVGKCLLATSLLVREKQLYSSTFEKFTDNTITDPEVLAKELEIIREQGYCLDAEEREYGLTCIGVPILDKKGCAEYAMSISGPTASITREMDRKILSLQETARAIGDALY